MAFLQKAFFLALAVFLLMITLFFFDLRRNRNGLKAVSTNDTTSFVMKRNATSTDWKDNTVFTLVRDKDIYSLKELIFNNTNMTASKVAAILGKSKPFASHNLEGTEPILTLFTTFSPSEKKRQIYTNTLKIWNLLRPLVTPVLFCPDVQCENYWKPQTEKFSWKLHIASNVSESDNIPLLKYMFMDVIAKYKSTFYGFSNGDILFDETLLKTLSALTKYTHDGEKMLIVGKRSNYLWKEEKIVNFKMVKNILKKSKLFSYWAEDYFFYTREAVDWSKAPNMVPGKQVRLCVTVVLAQSKIERKNPIRRQ